MNVQTRFKGTAPGYIRVELEHRHSEGWTVHVTEAESRSFVAGCRVTYGPLAWDEAIDIVAAALEGIEPGEGSSQEPY